MFALRATAVTSIAVVIDNSCKHCERNGIYISHRMSNA